MSTSYWPEYQVVDLSPYMDGLLEQEDIAERLSEEDQAKIVNYCKALHEMSYRVVSKRYDYWTEADRAHDVYVRPDATNFREKAVIPDTRAIADTVLTYMMAALAGRNPMFGIEGMNRKSRRAAAVLERVLHQGIRRTAGEARIAQQQLDSIRYGFAPTKILWDVKTNHNLVVNANPRRTFPDPRVPWGDWASMQYVCFSDVVSYNKLYAEQQYPRILTDPKLRQNPGFKSGWTGHAWHQEEAQGLSVDPTTEATSSELGWKIGSGRVRDEIWVRLGGYEIGVESMHMIWLVITILDEKEVIGLRLNPYGRLFPTVIGSLYHDVHKTMGQSLYDLILPLHDIATWLLRSRVDNVQAALNNLIFADPTAVSIPDLIDRNPWGIVRTLPGAKPGEGVYVAEIPDVTRGHWSDIAALSDMKQRVSAASDAAQGVPTPDVRTATEIQRLTQLGSQRLGLLSRLASATTVRPMVQMAVSNIQDAINYSGSIAMNEDGARGVLAPMVKEGYLDFSIEDLQGEVDYLVIDGTLPLEPTRDANTWMQMLTVLNQTGLMMEYDQGAIVEEAIRAMGVSDLARFRITPEQAQQGPTPAQQMALMEKMRGASVQPQENVEKELQKGNLVPMRQARG